MTCASDLIDCGHFRSPTTYKSTTLRTKITRSGERSYTYYRCTQHHKGDHARIRLPESDLDSQTHEIFDSLRTHNDGFRETIREGLRQAIKWDRKSAITNAKVLQLELESARQQQKRLTNHLLLAKIAPTTYAETARELRDKEVALKLEIDVNDRGRHELVNIAVKAFELSQRLRQKWLVAD